ncbi:hypothetical protein SKAU_G00241580 [Synaphobranchus kaupii]|uniref:Uncharacterized protein n=1 Tax=Synaphobranchus kaupii TaxID=118154 RepID=A0A9Q1F7K3_SYNKA|nr:hypothetical protein SKAU_G00241580 [Synaphobranchus kaupii]
MRGGFINVKRLAGQRWRSCTGPLGTPLRAAGNAIRAAGNAIRGCGVERSRLHAEAESSVSPDQPMGEARETNA